MTADFDIDINPDELGGWDINPDKPETWDRIKVTKERPVIVYRFYDAEPLLLYVGITNAPLNRFKGHSRRSVWWPEIALVRVLWCANRKVALRTESALIRREGPIWNRAGNQRGLMWAVH